MKIVIGGPAQSGKSCLRAGLKLAIQAIPDSPYPFFLTGCPDGEGAWFAETAAADPQLARKLKDEYKAKFTPEFARRIATAVTNCPVPMTLVDIGGKITPENRVICAPATHIVLLAGDKDGVGWRERLVPWQKFAAELGLVVVAEIYSDYYGTEDRVKAMTPDGVFGASVHRLDRLVKPHDAAARPGIQALAQHLVTLVQANG